VDSNIYLINRNPYPNVTTFADPREAGARPASLAEAALYGMMRVDEAARKEVRALTVADFRSGEAGILSIDRARAMGIKPLASAGSNDSDLEALWNSRN